MDIKNNFKSRFAEYILKKMTVNDKILSYTKFVIDFENKIMFLEILDEDKSYPKFIDLFDFAPKKIISFAIVDTSENIINTRNSLIVENKKGKEMSIGGAEWTESIDGQAIENFLNKHSSSNLSKDYNYFTMICGAISLNNLFFDKIWEFKNYSTADFTDDHYWNPFLEDYIFNNKPSRTSKEYFDWRNAVRERDKVCVCCGKPNDLHIHHINGFSEYPEQAYDLENGVALCSRCHDIYHGVYGNKDISKENFEKFMKRFSVM